MSVLLLPVRRPLLPVITVCAVIGRQPDAVMKLIDSGDLQFAFNLQGGSGARQCVRVLADSVSDYLNGKRAEKSFNDAFRLILPGASDHVPVAAVARAFCCSTEHVASLFKVTRHGRRGPNCSPPVARVDVVKLLKGRRIL